MAVLDVPRLSPDNFVEIVRTWLRDHAELNRLLSGEETGPRLVATCVAKAIDYYNTSGPPVTATLETFPSLSLLMDLTAIEVLQSAIFIKARNYLLYNDGATINVEANIELYERIINRLRAVADRQLDSVKVSVNIMGAFGDGVPSEYAWINGWLNTFEESL